VGVVSSSRNPHVEPASARLVEDERDLRSETQRHVVAFAMAGFGALAGLTSVSTACLVAGAAMSLLCAWTARRFGGPGS